MSLNMLTTNISLIGLGVQERTFLSQLFIFLVRKFLMLIICLKNLQIQKDGNWKKMYLFCCYYIFIFKSVDNYFIVFRPTSSFQRCLYFSWSELRPYIFPSFSLLGIIIKKIISDKVQKALLIIPFGLLRVCFLC